jgi:hypothetical protein
MSDKFRELNKQADEADFKASNHLVIFWIGISLMVLTPWLIAARDYDVFAGGVTVGLGVAATLWGLGGWTLRKEAKRLRAKADRELERGG